MYISGCIFFSRPHAYTKQEWFDGPHAMFYYNVEEDKQVLYGAK